jgi:regulator of sigma E protease
MDMTDIAHNLAAFFIVLSVIVFVHEFGHYIVAKLCGVRVTAFSIGFGKEIFGFNDRSGTRWKLSLLPLGGYVKMFGDATAASNADADAYASMSEDDKSKTFYHKPLSKKAAIVAAGPIANFILTITIFTYFIATSGLPSTDPIVGEVMEGSPAMEAGLQKGDRVLRINDEEVARFTDITYRISTNLGTPVDLLLERGGQEMHITLTPREFEDDDGLGNKIKRPLIGIRSMEIRYEDVGLGQALGESVRRTYMITVSTLQVIGQMVTGKRSTEDLKGPIGIAQLSGQAANKDLHTVLWLIALLSANLGLINLFPIPVLDGGHLLYYTAEAVSGRPLAEKVQEYGFKLGFVLIATLMVFTLINDVNRLL